jgi:beta-barrel assembly-enhancing protease
MNNKLILRKITVAVLLAAVWMVPIAALGQTRIALQKNKYKIQDDVKLGNDAAREVERQFPILNDAETTRYIENVGQRLVAAIPSQFQQPAFNYRFKVVNASDINAFALPGGPMFVMRGMIEASKNEGEMAGVMAHEISHVALRHATAQQTKQSSVGNQLGIIGMILGGAILGGQAGAELGAAGAMAWMTKYSREYETQADVLGAQIMTAAGYDPHDLANMFQTIQRKEGGSKVPQWLSDHPDPGNRYANINHEASLLSIANPPIKVTRAFERIQARLRSMPKARSMADIQKDMKKGQGPAANPGAGGRYSTTVQYPSSRVRTYSGGNWVTVDVPSNWQEFAADTTAQFAPDGAYGDQGITRGVMLGVNSDGKRGDIMRATRDYVGGLLQGNSYLSQRGGYTSTEIDGRQGYSTVLAGTSPITGRIEIVTVYTTNTNTDGLFYLNTVVPEDESGAYYSAFRNIINSVRLGG